MLIRSQKMALKFKFNLYYICLAQICISLINFTVIEASSVNKTEANVKRCRPGLVYINEPSREGCYPKVGLDQNCQFDIQCNLVVPYTFCAWRMPYYKSPICQCVDGFNATGTNDGCVPLQKCSISGFNSALDRADCLGDNQFCRNSYCFCKPNYQLNYLGDCELQPARDEEFDYYAILRTQTGKGGKSTENDDLNKALLLTNTRLEMMSKSLQSTQYVIILLLITYIMTVAVFICIYKTKDRKNNAMRTYKKQNLLLNTTKTGIY